MTFQYGLILNQTCHVEAVFDFKDNTSEQTKAVVGSIIWALSIAQRKKHGLFKALLLSSKIPNLFHVQLSVESHRKPHLLRALNLLHS